MTDEVLAVPKPARLRWLPWTVYAWVAVNLIAALTLIGQRSYISRQLVKANGKAKKPKADYVTGSHQLDHDVTVYIRASLIQVALTAAILVLVMLQTMRGRGWARWLLIGLATIIPLVFQVLSIGVFIQLVFVGIVSDVPIAYRVPEIIGGLAAAVVVAILFLPEVRGYYAGIRSAERGTRGGLFPKVGQRPAGARPTARPAGGLLGAFAGRGRPPSRTMPTSMAPIVIEADPSPAAGPKPKRAKAKSREQ